jgi:hypothetical protein
MTLIGRQLLELHDHANLLGDPDRLEDVREGLRAGDVYVARRVIDPRLLADIQTYLTGVGRHSLPNYAAIEAGAPNFHRMNRSDPRAYVRGSFHQFVFFPWNQDVFNLFELFAGIYSVKNVLSGLPADTFLGAKPQDGCTARLAFQMYPRGGGFLNRHSDPVDYHQLTVPILQMSTKGRDFSTGGLFVQMQDGSDLVVDDVTEPGDVVYFNARCPHGVHPIDPDAELRWLDYAGRWMLLFATNKLAGNAAIADAVDLGSPKAGNTRT